MVTQGIWASIPGTHAELKCARENDESHSSDP